MNTGFLAWSWFGLELLETGEPDNDSRPGAPVLWKAIGFPYHSIMTQDGPELRVGGGSLAKHPATPRPVRGPRILRHHLNPAIEFAIPLGDAEG